MRKRRRIPLQECRKCKTLADIKEYCKIDWDFGHYPIFIVAKRKTKAAVYDNHETADEVKPVRYSISLSTGRWDVFSTDRPNFSDIDVFLGAIKIFQKFPEKTYQAGTRKIGVHGYGFYEATVTGIKLSRNQLCEFFGKVPCGKSHSEARDSLVRLRSTTVYQEHKELTRQFRLVTDFTWETSESSARTSSEVEIIMDTAILDMCQKRKYQIRWRAIQGLKSQVAKGLLLYIDCNNLRKGKPGQPIPPGQPLLENRIFKFLYGLVKPRFTYIRHGDKPINIDHEYECLQEAKRQYGIDMHKYRNISREYRRQVNDGLNILREQKLISHFTRITKIKDGKKTERRLWMITKRKFGARPATVES